MIFVIEATDKVGRHVVSGLLDRRADVRALARDPDTAALPEHVDVVHGDLSDLAGLEEHLDAVEAVFLVWPFTTDEGAADVVEAIARHTPRIAYLSAQAAVDQPDAFWAVLERLIEASGVEWTFQRPTGFAANTLMWADRASEVMEGAPGVRASVFVYEVHLCRGFLETPYLRDRPRRAVGL